MTPSHHGSEVNAAHHGLVPPLRVVAALVAAGFVALAVISVSSNLDHRLRVVVLDTGGGSATLIRAPSGEVGLIGCGSQPDRLVGALGRVLPPTARRIDLLVLPGSSIRLTAGAAGLPGRYAVTSVVLSGAVSNPERATVETLEQAGTTVAGVGARAFSWAGVGILPLAVGGQEAGNAAVLVVSGGARALLLGDLDPATQEELAATTPVSLRADLVVAPSRGGVAVSLLAATRPRWIAVPMVAGQTDRTAWPGAQVARTGTDGELSYVADPGLSRS